MDLGADEAPEVDQVPDRPGVYLYKDAKGQVIYIGKAASLRSRVRSYFQESRARDPKTDALVGQIRDLDYIVTANELEALILESNLVKKPPSPLQHHPAGRQALSLPEADDERGVPAPPGGPAGAEGRRDLLRPVLPGDRDARDPPARAAAVPAADLPHQDRRDAAAARASSTTSTAATPRAPGWETREGYARTVQDVEALPRGPGRRPRPAPDARRWRRPPAQEKFERAARPARPGPGAEHGARAPEDHLDRAGGPGHRGRGRARAPRRACSSSSCASGRLLGRESFFFERLAGRERRRDPLRLHAPVLREERGAAARDPALGGAARDRRSPGSGWPSAAAGASSCSPPSAGAKRELVAMAEENAALALQTHLLARGSRQQVVLEELAARARPARAAAPHRGLRHLDASRGRETVGLHGRLAGRRHEEGRLQALQDPHRHRHRRLRVDARGADAGATGARWRARGCCPTSSCSTAGAASSSAGMKALEDLGLDYLPDRRPRQARGGGLHAGSPPAARARPGLARAPGAPEDPRRGASLRDHLPQEAAPAADHRLGARPDSRAWGRRSARACSRRWARRRRVRRPRWPSWPRCRRSPRSSRSASTISSTRARRGNLPTDGGLTGDHRKGVTT